MSPDLHLDPVTAARDVLLAAGGSELPRQPWQHPAEPASAHALIQDALRRANRPSAPTSTEELAAGLRLLGQAQSDLDTLEAALLLTARSEGMTWAQIAEALGLRSPQAAQQRFQRTARRPLGEASTSPRSPGAS